MLEQKAEFAKQRRQALEEKKQQQNLEQLVRWDTYREEKIKLIHEYVLVLKEQKRVKTWVAFIDL